MRLLAVTAGDDAQGRITEAEEIVGRVTFDGTLGLILFTGVFGGALCGALFLLVRRFLPAGRLGGVAYGLALLIVLGTVTDPLRKENPDFDLVGPGWVAVLVFTVLAIGFGVAVGGFTARASTWFPRFSARPRVLLRYAIPAIPFMFAAPAAAVGFVFVLVTRWRPAVNAVRSRRWTTGGQVLLIALVLLSLPNFISDVVDIVGR